MPVAEEKNKFKMPPVCLGLPVLWRPSLASDDVCAAIITQIGSDAVSLSLLPPSNRGCVPRDGCRHVSDPNQPSALANDPSQSGVWEHTKFTQLILDNVGSF